MCVKQFSIDHIARTRTKKTFSYIKNVRAVRSAFHHYRVPVNANSTAEYIYIIFKNCTRTPRDSRENINSTETGNVYGSYIVPRRQLK